MANTAPKVYERSFTLRVDDQFMREIDELRSMLDPIPSKADTLRYAVRETLRRVAEDEAKARPDAAKT